jgi:hypothetical protein
MSSLQRYATPFAVSLLTLALTGCLSSGGSSSNSGSDAGGPQPDLTLSVLSSAPDQVSGGDVLLSVDGDMDLVDAELDQLELWLNDQEIEATRITRRNGRLEVLVQGLAEGENTLQLHHAAHGPLYEMTLTNHPITGPIFSGPQQYPFVCTVSTELNKQPIVDTDEGMGFPVLDANNTQIGLSKDCSIESYVEFFYLQTPAGQPRSPCGHGHHHAD